MNPIPSNDFEVRSTKMPREIVTHLEAYIGNNRLFVGSVTIDGFALVPTLTLPGRRRPKLAMYSITGRFVAAANGTNIQIRLAPRSSYVIAIPLGIQLILVGTLCALFILNARWMAYVCFGGPVLVWPGISWLLLLVGVQWGVSTGRPRIEEVLAAISRSPVGPPTPHSSSVDSSLATIRNVKRSSSVDPACDSPCDRP